jgi:ribosomal protein S1
LSLKRLQPDPWSLVGEKYSPDDVVEGVVTNVVDFGAFVRLEAGVEGLVHVSEMPEDLTPPEAVSPGDLVLVRVLSIDANRQQIALSLRRLASWKRGAWESQQAEDDVDGEVSAPDCSDEPATGDRTVGDVEVPTGHGPVEADVAMPAP